MTETVTGAGLRVGDVVALDPAGDASWSGICHPGFNLARAYGGSVLAHAVAAANATVPEGMRIHSLHAYFLRPVDPTDPAVFTPRVVRDGSSYSVRRVEAAQRDRSLLDLTLSFKWPQDDAPRRLAAPPPPISDPEELGDSHTLSPGAHPLIQRVDRREARGVDGVDDDGVARRDGWFRLRTPVGDDPAAQACAIAYLSDFTLAPTAAARVQGPAQPHWRLASLDHALWFHGPIDATEWLRLVRRSRIEQDGRGFTTAEFWTRDGRHVASVAQDVLINVPD